MPKALPEDLRRDVARDFGISKSCLARWVRRAEIEDGSLCAAMPAAILEMDRTILVWMGLRAGERKPERG